VNTDTIKLKWKPPEVGNLRKAAFRMSGIFLPYNYPLSRVIIRKKRQLTKFITYLTLRYSAKLGKLKSLKNWQK